VQKALIPIRQSAIYNLSDRTFCELVASQLAMCWFGHKS